MLDPRETSPGSNMPEYSWLLNGTVDYGRTGAKMSTLAKLGVPYTDAQINGAATDAMGQAALITADLQAQGVTVANESELTALIGYLQRLGRGPQYKGGN